MSKLIVKACSYKTSYTMWQSRIRLGKMDLSSSAGYIFWPLPRKWYSNEILQTGVDLYSKSLLSHSWDYPVLLLLWVEVNLQLKFMLFQTILQPRRIADPSALAERLKLTGVPEVRLDLEFKKRLTQAWRTIRTSVFFISLCVLSNKRRRWTAQS